MLVLAQGSSYRDKENGLHFTNCHDIDADAAVAAKENAARNSVEFDVQVASVPENVEPVSLVVANIPFVVLRRIHELSSRVLKGGKLLLSESSVRRQDEMIRLAESQGLQFQSKSEQDGWVCLCLINRCFMAHLYRFFGDRISDSQWQIDSSEYNHIAMCCSFPLVSRLKFAMEKGFGSRRLKNFQKGNSSLCRGGLFEEPNKQRSEIALVSEGAVNGRCGA